MVKVNQVWRTKFGSMVLIVYNPPQSALDEASTLQMLWFDPIDKVFAVTEIFNRLDEKVSDNPAIFFNEMANKTIVP